jgi:peptidyl-prolyl cis-trans isomerase B (cyclophilin B)
MQPGRRGKVMKTLMMVLALTALILGCSSDKQENPEPSARVFAERPHVVLETDMGKVVMELFPEVAPNHVSSFIDLVEKGFYDNLTFHRVIKDKLIQGGDPHGDGTGKADYVLKAEFSNLQHLPGTVAMARGHERNSASCQFYICLTQLPNLDGRYTVFGQVIDGLDVAEKIGDVPVKENPAMNGEKTLPVDPVHIIRAYVLESSESAS